MHSSVPGKSARTMKSYIDKSRSINTMPASTFLLHMQPDAGWLFTQQKFHALSFLLACFRSFPPFFYYTFEIHFISLTPILIEITKSNILIVKEVLKRVERTTGNIKERC